MTKTRDNVLEGTGISDVEKCITGSRGECLDISVFGLGKIGLTLSSCLSAVGHRVVGVDVSQVLVDGINNHTLVSDEPGVDDRIKASLERLSATMDVREAIHKTNLSFIIVPTPSNTLGGFSLRFVQAACAEIGKAIRTKSGSHVVSLMSTVLPGSSDQFIIPLLEEMSGRKMGNGLGYCYSPSFIAQGEVVKGIENPDYILIGETDQIAGDLVLAAHCLMVPDSTPSARMYPIEAEITKLASNTHETMRVSFANMLLAACSEVPYANVDRVTSALSYRMGKRFFKGAVPFGGPCWPRDNKALSTFLDAIDVPSRMPRNVDLFNEEHGSYILRRILELSKPEDKIGILGLAYKPGTYLIERSFAVDLIHWLLDERRSVCAWDPLAMSEISRIIGDKISLSANGNNCLESASIIVIVNPLKELAKMDWSKGKAKTVIDCWRCLTPDQIELIGNYIPLGRGKTWEQNSPSLAIFRDKLELLTN